MFRLTLLCVVLAFSTSVQAASVVWSAAVNGFDLPNGDDVPVGSLVRLGTFNVTDAAIVQHEQDIGYLNEHFTEFASALIGDGGRPAGHFSTISNNNTAAAANLAGTQIYVWAFAGGSVATASAHGIFYMPKDTDPDWTFPAQNPVPGTTQIGTDDLTDAATNTTLRANAKTVIGALGPGTSSSTNKPNFTLVAVPEPASGALLLAAAGLFGVFRRRR